MKIAKSNNTYDIHHGGQKRYCKIKKINRIKQAKKRKENTVSISAFCFDHTHS